jgi:hypothetical protein
MEWLCWSGGGGEESGRSQKRLLPTPLGFTPRFRNRIPPRFHIFVSFFVPAISRERNRTVLQLQSYHYAKKFLNHRRIEI